MLPRVNVVRCNEADYILFSTADAISNVLYRTGQWEEYLLSISKALLQGVEAPLILDIGANLGAYSIPLAKNIQSIGGNVIGFEPQRVVYYQLCGNIVLNRLDNYEAFYLAIGASNGNVDIPDIDYAENTNIGAFSLSKSLRERLNTEKFMKGKFNSVDMISLNSLKTDRSPSLIKIDVEGFELEVLKGGEDFLRNHHYPPIMFEAWNLDWFDYEREKLLGFVKYLGYEISLNIRDEYVAQHPEHPTHVKFDIQPNGSINMLKVR